jgi:hypothetical protein
MAASRLRLPRVATPSRSTRSTAHVASCTRKATASVAGGLPRPTFRSPASPTKWPRACRARKPPKCRSRSAASSWRLFCAHSAAIWPGRNRAFPTSPSITGRAASATTNSGRSRSLRRLRRSGSCRGRAIAATSFDPPGSTSRGQMYICASKERLATHAMKGRSPRLRREVPGSGGSAHVESKYPASTRIYMRSLGRSSVERVDRDKTAVYGRR